MSDWPRWLIDKTLAFFVLLLGPCNTLIPASLALRQLVQTVRFKSVLLDLNDLSAKIESGLCAVCLDRG